MTLDPLDPRTAARAPQAEPAQPAARWLLVSPDDEVGRRLAARLGMTLGMTPGMTLGTAPENPPGGSRFVSGTAAALLSPGDGERAWDAVVYRPPRWSGFPGQPDLADATAFFGAFAQAYGGSGGGGRDDRWPRLVLVSSAAAVSPSHHHPGWAAESERPQGRNPIARSWLELEALAAASLRGPAAAGRRASAELIVLRPAAVAAADGEDVLCSVLRGRVARVPAGFDPTVQLLSPDDLAGAVEHALRRGAGKPGIYHVAPAGAMPLRAALRMAGARRLPLGVLPGGGRLDYLRHSSTVSGDKIERELGFTPRASSAAAVLAELAPPGDQRDRRDHRDRSDQRDRRGREEATAAPGLAEVPQFDPYGQDKLYIAAYGRTLFRFLHDA